MKLKTCLRVEDCKGEKAEIHEWKSDVEGHQIKPRTKLGK